MASTVVIIMMAVAFILLLYAFILLFPYLQQEARDDEALIRTLQSEDRTAGGERT